MTATEGDTERIDTLIIGGGQAGLSAGYHLLQRGMPFLILDADERIGDHWRDRWDSLRLYSPARWDSLPGFRFPARAFHYPTGREMGDYLEAYADRFALPVRSGVRVERLDPAPDGDGFIATMPGRQIAARQVVVATGPFRIPHVPAFAA
jgi:putative flavoprotein involved in K+ transport